MIPVPVMIGVPVAGYAVWRAFGPKKRQAPGAAEPKALTRRRPRPGAIGDLPMA